MKIFYNKLIPFKGFTAINIFGYLFVRKGKNIDATVINHEKIHSAQMRELLFVPFYIVYLLEWLIRVVQYKSFYKAYRNLSFEKEAYTNDADLGYLKHRKSFQWIKYI